MRPEHAVRVLSESGPVGLGHATRDLAIAAEHILGSCAGPRPMPQRAAVRP